nr:hypothetical protein [Chloroflexaceae bacterium]
DPEQVAFCLRSALKLNPDNERANQGLRWLEEKHNLSGADKGSGVAHRNGTTNGNGVAHSNGATNGAGTVQTYGLPAIPNVPARPRAAQVQREPWWVQWRQTRRENSRIRLVLWSVPLVLVCLSLLIYHTMANAVAEREAAMRPTVAPSLVAEAVLAQPTPVPVLEVDSGALRDSQAMAYLSALDPLRTQLNSAVESYVTVTSQPGGLSVGNVAAAQTLRTTVEQARATLAELNPPRELQTAHADYQRGLELESQALDELLEFYGSYNVEQANRAAQNLQAAQGYIERALATFTQHQQLLQQASAVSAHAIR